MYQKWQHSVACKLCFGLQPVCAQLYTTYPCRHFHETVLVAGVMTIFIKISYWLPCTHGRIPHVHEVSGGHFGLQFSWWIVNQFIYKWKFPDMTWLAEDVQPTSLKFQLPQGKENMSAWMSPHKTKGQNVLIAPARVIWSKYQYQTCITLFHFCIQVKVLPFWFLYFVMCVMFCVRNLPSQLV